jgi:NAD(P)-dependent dehydrogenase (short-subunit alcohol dehydrogenase family)
MAALAGKVAVVTGASRGIGKATALALGQAGATVYLTGRTLDPAASRWPGTITQTAREVTRLGGHGIPVRVDHRDDNQVSALFDRVRAEQGQLHVLVNNATGFPDTATGYPPQDLPCWQLPIALWDQLHQVGLRSAYVAAVLAAPIMLTTGGHRLIASISSAGAARYTYGTAYGAAKAGLDKLTADLACELRPHQVTVVSVWPPLTTTEKVLACPGAYDLANACPPALTGRAVAALAADPGADAHTGHVLTTTEIANHYGLTSSPARP